MIKIALSNSLLSATGWLVGMLISIVLVVGALAVVLVVALKPVKKYQTEEDDTVKKLDRRETEITIKLLEHSTNPQQTEALLKELRDVTLAERVVHRIAEQDKAHKAPPPQQGKPAAANAKGGQVQGKPAQPTQPTQSTQSAQPAKPQGVQPAQPAQPQGMTAQPTQPAKSQGNPVQPAQPAQPHDKPVQAATANSDTTDKKD